jgi:hypothetical protein
MISGERDNVLELENMILKNPDTAVEMTAVFLVLSQ